MDGRRRQPGVGVEREDGAEAMPDGWWHATITLNPRTGQMYAHGDPRVRTWLTERLYSVRLRSWVRKAPFRLRWALRAFLWRLRVPQRLERATMGMAWALPRSVAYWCAIRVGAHATTGKWGATDPNDLGVMEMLRRWEKPNER